MVHPNKSGYIFVYDRADAKIENVCDIVKASNFVKSIDPKTGELIGRRDFTAGKQAEPLSGDRRRRQLEFRRIQSADRALLQDRK